MICNWSLVLASLPPPKILLSATSGDIIKYLTWKEREREENLGPGWGGGEFRISKGWGCSSEILN